MLRGLSALAAIASIAAIAASATSTLAQSPNRTKVGTLTCDVSGGVGLIITSQKSLRCTFDPADAGPRELYTGTITKFGLDIGATTGGVMVWAVFAPSTRRFGALAGHYAGATAEATVGAGIGANALIGGSDRTVTLQPLSVQGQVGLNLAAGVASIDLRSAR
jgi:Protein of unknown function (DUF992)